MENSDALTSQQVGIIVNDNLAVLGQEKKSLSSQSDTKIWASSVEVGERTLY